MNAVLTIGYDRYVLSIEDAAKVMKLLSEAKHVSYCWANDETGTPESYAENQRKTALEIAPLTLPVTAYDPAA